MKKRIRILLVDDHALVRSGFRQILEQVKEIQICGEARTGQEALDQIPASKPDVLILDLKLPDLSGLEVTQKVVNLEEDIKIIIVSSITHYLTVFRLLEAGAQGYLPKSASPEELVRTIKAVYRGQRVISPQLASRLALTKKLGLAGNVFDPLSEREIKILQEVIRGLSASEIAKKLGISPKTVHSYRDRIFEKLQVKGDVALTLFAIHHGMITLDPTESDSG